MKILFILALGYFFWTRGLNTLTMWVIGLTILFFLILLIVKRERLRVGFHLFLITSLFITNFYAKESLLAAKEGTVWYLKHIKNLKKGKKITLYDGFIFRSFYLHGREYQNIPIRLNYYGDRVLFGDTSSITKNYVHLSLKPTQKSNFCATFAENVFNNKIDILIIGKNPEGKLPSQSCVELGKYYSILVSQEEGVIYYRRS